MQSNNFSVHILNHHFHLPVIWFYYIDLLERLDVARLDEEAEPLGLSSQFGHSFSQGPSHSVIISILHCVHL